MKLQSGLRSKSENEKLAELNNAKAELQRVKAEAAGARQAAEHLRASVAKSRRDTKFRLRVTAVVMLTAALIKILWLSAQSPTPTATIAAPLPSTASAALTAQTTQARETLGSAGDVQFSRALDRLRDAFHSFPEEDQKDVVREINQRYAGGAMACPLDWNDAGMPSLYLGDKKGNVPPSIITALNECASELEKLRVERGPAKPL